MKGHNKWYALYRLPLVNDLPFGVSSAQLGNFKNKQLAGYDTRAKIVVINFDSLGNYGWI